MTESRMKFLVVFVTLLPLMTYSLPEQGKWDHLMNETQPFWGVHKSLFAGANVHLTVHCLHENENPDLRIRIKWLIRKTPCWEEYASLDFEDYPTRRYSWETYLHKPDLVPESLKYSIPFYANKTEEDRCDATIKLKKYILNANGTGEEIATDSKTNIAVIQSSPGRNQDEIAAMASKAAVAEPILVIPEDGVYLLAINIEVVDQGTQSFSANVHIEMKSDYGYLSAVDWPFLHFYLVMCALYFIMSCVWIVLCATHWRDLLRVQMWIFAVSFLGMIEMAVFYAEYQSINSTGVSVTGAVLLAEIISCAKRTLARLLVVIVSLGFGIVKPRLGETLHRLVAVGVLYFFLASTEASLRILHPINGSSNRALMASIALSVLDAGICWWIFHALLSTTRTLRLRRNLVKLSLYRSFTNTLIFAVITSVGFMIWSIKFIKTAECLRDWKDIWIDDAYWHALFSVILFFIMLLWRPTNNNQRYSFSPLIDVGDDDEEEEDLVVNESFGNMKLRQKRSPSEKFVKGRNANLDEELRWVDENIPNDLAEGDLPALDSDEELMTSKFELSKMQ
ncbi:unnamed protein product [Allacma fusca]|uniref:Transmembrane protein 87A n=1 Tax=Allacma fusca TaxID=39272 RepID=A0A8J2KBU1_9HEXA|nr:unnamed protein product [Allacma fusca]